jgi:hypothetical protein
MMLRLSVKVGDLVRWTMPEGALIGIVIESVYSGGAFWVLTQRGKRRVCSGLAEVINASR